MLAVVGLVGWRIIVVTTDAGVEANGKTAQPECAVSQPVLDAAKVSVNTSNDFYDGITYACGYTTRKGSDGLTESNVSVPVTKLDTDMSANHQWLEARVRENTLSQVKPGPPIGDKSYYTLREYVNKTYIDLYIQRGDTMYKVGYYGFTNGFFGVSPVAVDRVEADTLAIAKDVMKIRD